MDRKVENRSHGKWAWICFFAIVMLLSAVVEILFCCGGPDWLIMVLMWIPALAAAVANCVAFWENGHIRI